MGRLPIIRRSLFAGSLLAVAALISCGGDGAIEATSASGTGSGPSGSGGAGGSGGGGSGTGGFISASSGGCTNLECQQVVCEAGKTTTLRGTVYEPAGQVPLYNVVVYVPNAPLAPVEDGVSCVTCETALSGEPIAATLTDIEGEFVLENVPVGSDIPLVLQIGKWRRLVTVPAVEECTENVITDVGLTRLPRNQAEGHIPRIALATGGADPLACLLRKIGIDDAEFTSAGGAGRVHLYAAIGGSSKFGDALNGGAAFAPADALWSDAAALASYDVVLLACEGTHTVDNKPASSAQALLDYTHLGGRLFVGHEHHPFIELAPAPVPSVAVFEHQPDLPSPYPAMVDGSFPKGAALAEWLVNVGASASAGAIDIVTGQDTVVSLDAKARRWIYGTNPDAIQYFTFNTPLDAPPEGQCGRVVYTDIHVASGDSPTDPFPDACTTTGLSPQEKALLFILFDLSSCLQPDDEPPEVPK